METLGVSGGGGAAVHITVLRSPGKRGSGHLDVAVGEPWGLRAPSILHVPIAGTRKSVPGALGTTWCAR